MTCVEDMANRLRTLAVETEEKTGLERQDHVAWAAADALEALQRRIRELETRLPAPVPALMSAFDQFWQAYPCKKGKPVAEKAFRKVAGEFCAIMAGLEQYKRHKPDYADWMHPSTFLNQRRWEDEYDAPATGRTYNAQKDGLALLLQEANRREANVASESAIAGKVVQFLPRADMERGGDAGEGGNIPGRAGRLF
jgi:hypothetical protein